MSRITHRVLLLGGAGQLGSAIQELAPGSWSLQAPTSSALPLQDADALHRTISQFAPQVVINAAAYTRVDDAETDEAGVMRVNRDAPAALSALCAAAGSRFVHLSTDYVFDGAQAPYAPSAVTAPVNVYGRSKRDGESLVLRANPHAVIVRTSWLHSGGGTNFVGNAVRTLLAGTSMRVVDDQVGAPTTASTLAEAVIGLAQRTDITGIEHVTDSGVASWYDVARCVLDTLRQAGAVASDVTVTPVSTEAFPRPARRPRVSLLDTHGTRARLGLVPPHWREGVMRSTTQWLARARAEKRDHG